MNPTQATLEEYQSAAIGRAAVLRILASGFVPSDVLADLIAEYDSATIAIGKTISGVSSASLPE